MFILVRTDFKAQESDASVNDHLSLLDIKVIEPSVLQFASNSPKKEPLIQIKEENIIEKAIKKKRVKPIFDIPLENQPIRCTCNKSKCKKKYCECFKANKPCNVYCHCYLCKNKGHKKRKHVFGTHLNKKVKFWHDMPQNKSKRRWPKISFPLQIR